MDWKWLAAIENSRPFTEGEAWWLYRAVALGEAAGWTVLLAGLAVRHYQLPGRVIAVPLAGQIHGMLFLAYFGILVAVSTSLRWSRRQLLVALLAGIPPYGSIIFEQWVARNRKTTKSYRHFYTIALVVLSAR